MLLLLLSQQHFAPRTHTQAGVVSATSHLKRWAYSFHTLSWSFQPRECRQILVQANKGKRQRKDLGVSETLF